MTAPIPNPLVVPLTAATDVRQDPSGAVVVVLAFLCGPTKTELMIDPGDAARFGEGIANALKVAAEQAAALAPGLVVPPKGLIIPQNGHKQ